MNDDLGAVNSVLTSWLMDGCQMARQSDMTHTFEIVYNKWQGIINYNRFILSAYVG